MPPALGIIKQQGISTDVAFVRDVKACGKEFRDRQYYTFSILNRTGKL
jgi:hypothetical protein